MDWQSYKVYGMDCAEEVAILRSALDPLTDGPEGLQFNLLQGKLSLLPRTNHVSDSAVVSAIARTGMRAVPWRQHLDRQEAPAAWWHRRGRGLFCAVSGVSTLGGFLYHGFSGGWLVAVAASETQHFSYPVPSAALYGTAIVTGCWYVLPKAAHALRRLRADINLLMVVAVIGAVLLGNWFEGALVGFLFSTALLLESWSIGRARRAIGALMDLTPPRARHVLPGGEEVESLVESVPVDAIVRVRPGERVPLDGEVIRGMTSVNQAPITGESRPVPKAPGDLVFAGTINNEGAFEFRTTKTSENTNLTRIIRMVEEAQARRAPAEQWVEKFARYYTPLMILIAALVAVAPPVWLSIPWSESVYAALVMLLIACPCALVISTPVSIVAGISAAARAGVLIKGGAYLEAPSRMRAIALDKTGTLTRGQPEVQRVVPLNGYAEDHVLALAAALEAESTHPLAAAILRSARKKGLAIPTAGAHVAVPGKGVSALLDGRKHWAGNHRMLLSLPVRHEPAISRAAELEDAGHSVVIIGCDKEVWGLISIADSPRQESRPVVEALRREGVERIVMLTGDNAGTAGALAATTGVDDFYAELLPEDKVERVSEMARKYGDVAMVGDGVNDAPAMAVSSLGIAMGAAGSDAAIETADIALMGDDLTRLPWLIRHSRKTVRIIRQNVVVALGLKAAVFALALAGWATLWLAIVADMGASLLVIFNSLRLLRVE